MTIDLKNAEKVAEATKAMYEDNVKAQTMKALDSDRELMDAFIKTSVETEKVQIPSKQNNTEDYQREIVQTGALIVATPAQLKSDNVYFPISLTLPGATPTPTPVVTPISEDEKRRKAMIIGGVSLFVLIALIAYSSYKSR